MRRRESVDCGYVDRGPDSVCPLAPLVGVPASVYPRRAYHVDHPALAALVQKYRPGADTRAWRMFFFTDLSLPVPAVLDNSTIHSSQAPASSGGDILDIVALDGRLWLADARRRRRCACGTPIPPSAAR